MTKPTDLTPEAREGFAAASDARCPYLATSSTWQAWHLGRYLAQAGYSEPYGVRAGRGSLMWANGWQWRVEPERHFNREATVTPHGRR